MNYDHENYDHEEELKDAATLLVFSFVGFLAVLGITVWLVWSAI